MSTSLANPRRTKLDAWPTRPEVVKERDQAAAPAEPAKQAEKRSAGK